MNYSVSEFEKALQKLDEKLDITNHESIVVHAIGGFAMLYYGMTAHDFTMDIDSLTEKYDTSVIGLIEEVGKELDMNLDWLNTDCATLQGFMTELEPNIKWTKAKYNFRKIDFYVADILGLFESKVKAVHDGGLVPRTTDKKDMMLILKLLNVNNIEIFEKQEEIKSIVEKYKRSYEYIKNIGEW